MHTELRIAVTFIEKTLNMELPLCAQCMNINQLVQMARQHNNRGKMMEQ
jgi:hypothetical protein